MSMVTTRLAPFSLFLLASLVACAPPSDFDEDEEDAEEESDAIGDTVRFDVITHNIAGGMLNFGKPEALNNVEGEIAEARPDAVMLQEVCQTQADAFAASHPAWGIHFVVTRPNHPNCGPLGNLIASPHGLSNVDATDLGHADPGRITMLLCGDVKLDKRKGKVRICSAHLRSRGDDPVASEAARTLQVLNLVAALKPHIDGHQGVIVAGDMNSGPKRELLDPMYRLKRNGNWGGGQFDELDQTDPKRESYRDAGITCAPNACRSGEPTHDNSKLDHIFVSNNLIAGDIEGRVKNAGKSDHHLYRGSAVLNLPKKKK
jgi:endonuclease/exonuclease/phosphatase family metal-dependent hydrolase